jgi:hypothetical protein
MLSRSKIALFDKPKYYWSGFKEFCPTLSDGLRHHISLQFIGPLRQPFDDVDIATPGVALKTVRRYDGTISFFMS